MADTVQQTMTPEDIARQAARMARDVDRRLERQWRVDGHSGPRPVPTPTQTRAPSEPPLRRIQSDMPVRGRECILCSHDKDETRLGKIDKDALARQGKLTPEAERLIQVHGGPSERDYHICKTCVEVNGKNPLHSEAYRIANRSIEMEHGQTRIARPQDFERLAQGLLDDLHKSRANGEPTMDAVGAARRIGDAQGLRDYQQILTQRFDFGIDQARGTIAQEVGSKSWDALIADTKRAFDEYAAQFAHSKSGLEAQKAIDEFAKSIPGYELSETQMRRMAGETLSLDDEFQQNRTSADYGLTEDRVLDTNDVVRMSSSDIERATARIGELTEVENLGLVEGTVKWYDAQNGIGMVTAQGGDLAGRDFFVHETGIHGYGVKDISPSHADHQVAVVFEAVRTKDGLLAAESLARQAQEPLSAEIGSSWPTKVNEAIGTPLHREAIQQTHQMDLASQQGHRYAYEQTRGIENDDLRRATQEKILASWERNPNLDKGKGFERVADNVLSANNPLAGYQSRPEVPNVTIDGVRLGEAKVAHSGLDEAKSSGDLGAMRYHFNDVDSFVKAWAEKEVRSIQNNPELSPEERADRITHVQETAKLPNPNPDREFGEPVREMTPHEQLMKQAELSDPATHPERIKDGLQEYLRAQETTLVKDFGNAEYEVLKDPPSLDGRDRYTVTDMETGRFVGKLEYDEIGQMHARVDPAIETPARAEEILRSIDGKVDVSVVSTYVEAPALPPSDRISLSEGVQLAQNSGQRYMEYQETSDALKGTTVRLESAQDIMTRLEHASTISRQDRAGFNDSVAKAFKNPDQVRADLGAMTPEARREAFASIRDNPKEFAKTQGWEIKDASYVHAAAAHGNSYNNSKMRLTEITQEARKAFDVPKGTLQGVHEAGKARISELSTSQRSLQSALQSTRGAAERFARDWKNLTPGQQRLAGQINPAVAKAAEGLVKSNSKALESQGHSR